MNDAVRRITADDVAEAEDPTAHLVAGSEGGDQRFAGDLAGRVKRDREERAVVFGSGQHRRLAINRAAAGEDELLRAGDAHGLEEVVRDERPALEIEVGVARAETDVAVGGKMPDQLGTNPLKE